MIRTLMAQLKQYTRASILAPVFTVGEVFTGRPGLTVDLKDTIAGCEGIVRGDYDDLPEQAFFMVGKIEDAVQKAQEMKTQQDQKHA